ncbi:hypothetical protein RJ639_015661 [Escallonia herrerae]|uniref:S-adenosylmethionine-dependent methyltransferase n=1 Tax=Escallonia herrerae TaxID=1293975 RepID=A0AA89ALT7_9ASTE|nr:hypothetical protein RJ639_015661 [Escallonia herrerae]
MLDEVTSLPNAITIVVHRWEESKGRHVERVTGRGARQAKGTMAESFPMNGGDGTYSYAKNSHYQREATNVAKEMINEVIAEKLDVQSLIASSSNSFCIADLGCSVGPNTFFAMQNLLEVVDKKYVTQGATSESLEFQVFFSDHASNDFNTLFASLPPSRKYFAAGVPGSFYGRLFPRSSLHLVHSSYALQWLSKVPEELLDKTSPAWNKGKINYTSSSDEVANAYAAQFQKDMKIFLNARAEEIVVGGMLVLIMAGLPDGIHRSKFPLGVFYDSLCSSLMDMVDAGLINESQVDSFNLPVYAATPKEITEVIKDIGCFSIERMEVADPRSKLGSSVNVPSLIMHFRAGLEDIFTKHFGCEVIDELFERTFLKEAEISSALESSYKKGNQLIVALKRE